MAQTWVTYSGISCFYYLQAYINKSFNEMKDPPGERGLAGQDQSISEFGSGWVQIIMGIKWRRERERAWGGFHPKAIGHQRSKWRDAVDRWVVK
jgi:hypothetical protein